MRQRMEAHDVGLREQLSERDMGHAIVEVFGGKLHIGVADENPCVEAFEQPYDPPPDLAIADDADGQLRQL